MKLFIALSRSIEVDAVEAGLRAGGWVLDGGVADDGHERVATLLSQTDLRDRLPALLVADPEARVVVAFRSIASELALAIAEGQAATVALDSCRAFVRDALGAFRRIRRGVVLVVVGAEPSGAEALGLVVSAPIVLGAEPPIDPVLGVLVRRLLEADAPTRRDLEELDASAIAPGVVPAVPDTAEAIEHWRAGIVAMRSGSKELARLGTRLEAVSAELDAARALAGEREAAASEEISLLREQLRASQERIEELETAWEAISPEVSRQPPLKSCRLHESVDLSPLEG